MGEQRGGASGRKWFALVYMFSQLKGEEPWVDTTRTKAVKNGKKREIRVYSRFRASTIDRSRRGRLKGLGGAADRKRIRQEAGISGPSGLGGGNLAYRVLVNSASGNVEGPNSTGGETKRRRGGAPWDLLLDLRGPKIEEAKRKKDLSARKKGA